MENVVTAIFGVESEAFQAFSRLRSKSGGEGYSVAGAALVKRKSDGIEMVDSFDAVGVTSNDTTAGILIGSVVGILGGPLGMLLGASAGALTGSLLDSADAVDNLSALELVAAKLYDGDVAIVSLVQENESAFDAAFDAYDVTIVRQYAVDVLDELDRARELEAELANEARMKLRDDRKAERKTKREDRKAAVRARFDQAMKSRDERKDAFDEAVDMANAEYARSTKEMLGTE